MAAAILTPRARNDLIAATHWIGEDNPAAAQGLRRAVAAAADRISAHPEIGLLRPEYADEPVRFFVLTGYPYILVYYASSLPPRIERVLHGARDIPSVLGRI